MPEFINTACIVSWESRVPFQVQVQKTWTDPSHYDSLRMNHSGMGWPRVQNVGNPKYSRVHRGQIVTNTNKELMARRVSKRQHIAALGLKVIELSQKLYDVPGKAYTLCSQTNTDNSSGSNSLGDHLQFSYLWNYKNEATFKGLLKRSVWRTVQDISFLSVHPVFLHSL